MFTCKCGKSYKHQPSLVRHQNGSVKYSLKPCLHHVNGLLHESMTHTTSVSLINKAECLMSRIETLDSNPSCDLELKEYQVGIYPSFIEDYYTQLVASGDRPFNERLLDVGKSVVCSRVIRRITETCKSIHFNKEHPEYWNVYLANVNMKRLYVYMNEKWVTQDLHDWARDFGKMYLLNYWTIAEKRKDDSIGFFIGFFLEDSDNKKLLAEYYRAFMLMLQSESEIRNKIKAKHKFR